MRTVNFAFGILVVLIIQLEVTHQKTNGEYCHGWKNAESTLREGFHCPDRHDQREAVICCGTCELRYCCPLTKARLDQGNCYNHEHALHPGTTNDEKYKTSTVPDHVPFVIVGSVFLAFIFLGSMVAMGVFLSPKQETCRRPGGAAGLQDGGGEQQQEAVPVTLSSATSCGSTSSLYPPRAPQGCPTGPTHLHQTLMRQGSPNSAPLLMATPSTMHSPVVYSSLVHPSVLHYSVMHPYLAEMPHLYMSQEGNDLLPSPCPSSSHTSIQAMEDINPHVVV